MRIFRIAAAVAATAGVLACSNLPGLGSDDDADSPGGGDGQPGTGWQSEATAIDGIVVFDPAELSPDHVEGPITYPVLPPVGGPHNGFWQDCTGVVYDDQIANEHAVHSLEHGAVWITYHPSVPDDHVTALADRVAGVDKLMMSPFPALDAPISLQAWGHQLKAERADDPRIDEFIRTLRDNAGPEAGVAPCGGPNAITATGTTPTIPG